MGFVTWLHVRHHYGPVMDFDASDGIRCFVNLNWVTAAALAIESTVLANEVRAFFCCEARGSFAPKMIGAFQVALNPASILVSMGNIR